MKFFSKLKAKRMQIIAAAVLASSVGLCHAAVTLPIAPLVTPVTLPVTFTAGTPAKAADVNADFQAVSNGIQSVNNGLQAVNSGVQAVNNGLPNFLGSSTAAAPTLSAGATNLTLFVGTAPSVGPAVITASGQVCAGVINNTAFGGALILDTVTLQITVDGVAAGQPFVFANVIGNVLTMSQCTGFSLQAVISALAAGKHTIAVQGSGNGTGLGGVANLTLSGILYH